MSAQKKSPEECPICGAEVPAGARSCPECGADDRTGWNEENTRYDGMDLPDEAFDYDESLKDERLKPRVVPKGVPVFWWVAGVILLLAVITWTVAR